MARTSNMSKKQAEKEEHMNIPMIRMPGANKLGSKCMCLSYQKHHDGEGSVEEKWDKKPREKSAFATL